VIDVDLEELEDAGSTWVIAWVETPLRLPSKVVKV
jgi:hypothetical protein